MPKVGVEPTRGQAPPDFESGASTGSATSEHRNTSPTCGLGKTALLPSFTTAVGTREGGGSRGNHGFTRAMPKGLAREAQWPDTSRHGAVTASGHRRGTEEELVRQRPFLGLLIAAVAVLALIATGCGSKKSSSGTTSTSSSGGGVTALPASSC